MNGKKVPLYSKRVSKKPPKCSEKASGNNQGSNLEMTATFQERLKKMKRTLDVVSRKSNFGEAICKLYENLRKSKNS